MTTKRADHRKHTVDTDKLVERPTRIVRELLEDELPEGSPFEEYEEKALEIANEIVRRELQRKLQTIADGFPEQLRIDHNNDWHGWREGTAFDYRKHQPGVVTYHSLVGGLRVTRFTYREKYRNAPTYVPLELEAGLMEQLTPGLAKCVTLGFADMPMRRFERLLVAAGRNPPSRSTLERSAGDLGSYAVKSNEEMEPLMRKSETIPADARCVLLGLDRVAVPMRPADAQRGHMAVARDLRRSRPKRQPDSAKGAVQWRMDYVGTVTLNDRAGKVLVRREYRLPSDCESQEIVDKLIADVRHALEQQPKLRVAVVQDGAPELWKVIGKALDSEPAVHEWVEILDWYHLDERLTKCLELCVPDSKRSALRRRWHKQLNTDRKSIRSVTRSLKSRARKLDTQSREQLNEHVRFLEKQTGRTHYASYRGSPSRTLGRFAKRSEPPRVFRRLQILRGLESWQVP